MTESDPSTVTESDPNLLASVNTGDHTFGGGLDVTPYFDNQNLGYVSLSNVSQKVAESQPNCLETISNSPKPCHRQRIVFNNVY